MKLPLSKAIDCDIHPALPSLRDLLPHLTPFWQDMVEQSGLHELDSVNYPLGSPLTARSDWRPVDGSKPASSLELVREQSLDRFGASYAICNCLYGVQLLFNEDLAASIARALNSWIASDWLDKDPRLRASIVLPVQNIELAVEEIEYWASDKRFVQVLLLAMSEVPLGRRHYWPIFAAAERHGLPIGIHAGSSFRHPTTPVGWTSYYAEDYVNQAQGFQTQLTSLICEGALTKFPDLRVVLLESGFTWLPGHLWHIDKFWRGLRMEVPWLDRPPSEIVRDQVRLTLQPVDAPSTLRQCEQLFDQMGSDRLLLYSSDYPHWQFDDDEVLPEGMPESLIERILWDNPRETYTRLEEAT